MSSVECEHLIYTEKLRYKTRKHTIQNERNYDTKPNNYDTKPENIRCKTKQNYHTKQQKYHDTKPVENMPCNSSA